MDIKIRIFFKAPGVFFFINQVLYYACKTRRYLYFASCIKISFSRKAEIRRADWHEGSSSAQIQTTIAIEKTEILDEKLENFARPASNMVVIAEHLNS